MRNLLTLATLLTGFLAPAASAAPLTAPDFTIAADFAKEKSIPVAVLVHGSSWHRASKNFGEKIWASPEFTSALRHPVILTTIHIRQNITKEQAAEDATHFKGWNPKSVTTYPAVQIISADGHLLKTYSGRALRVLTTPDSLAHHINHILTLAAKRRTLIEKARQARASNQTAEELKHLTALAALPLDTDPKTTEKLKQADPQDHTGWQARLTFKGWDFVRDITTLVRDNKTSQAIAECDRQLAIPNHPPEQRALILGAKARALVAQDKLTEAWQLFQQAYRTDPTGPNSKAMLAYGIHAAGVPLRETFPLDSTLRGKPVGTNLTKGHATYSLSSSQDDNLADRPTLFAGSYASAGYAFHTGPEKDAHIIIDLQAPCQLKALRITNRNSNAERAATLTVWTSTDRTQWQKIWQAEKARPVWEILTDPPVTARYLKIGLDSPTPTYLHLRAVDAFGTRP